KNNKDFLLRNHKRKQRVFVIGKKIVRNKIYCTNNVVIVTSSHENFKEVLTDLKNSVNWNHEVFFLIVYDDAQNNCESAQEFLNTAWTFHILNAIYLCPDNRTNLHLYSFNPFNALAPKFWNVVTNSSSTNNHWTLLELDHQFVNLDKTLLSQDLYFDKVKDINGYNFKAVTCITHLESIQFDRNKSGYDRFKGAEYQVFNEILKRINATVTMKITYNCGFINDKKLPEGTFKDVLVDGIELCINPILLRDFVRYETYPFYSLKISIVTLNTEFNLAEQIYYMFPFKVWILWAFTFSTSIITLAYFMRLSLSSAALEVLRMLVNTSATRQPRGFSEKSFYVTLIFAFFVINTFIQCRLSQMSTIPGYMPSVDSADDLINSDLEIHGDQFYRDFIFGKIIQDRYHVSHISDCFRMLLNGKRIACIFENKSLRFYVYETELIHISTDSLLRRGIVFVCSEDSPFLSKMNWILTRLNGGGFIKLFYARQDLFYLKYQKDNEKKSLDIKKITIAFQLLLGGWILSIIIVVFEIIHLHFSKYAKKHRIRVTIVEL
ncbi:hypothetical protein TSAR_010029, partial [Trichomalopsis sarcophagae]